MIIDADGTNVFLKTSSLMMATIKALPCLAMQDQWLNWWIIQLNLSTKRT